ncbi:unnamed protein product [Paramecium octaurelia]|uniref:Uncharacterized protein n=1 Tax=Paramecium octaurelia TaxID=43137 RepID=A0A8S1VQC2_PAROT|nr:unnamed protein product [Paramecium octaurelia]
MFFLSKSMIHYQSIYYKYQDLHIRYNHYYKVLYNCNNQHSILVQFQIYLSIFDQPNQSRNILVCIYIEHQKALYLLLVYKMCIHNNLYHKSSITHLYISHIPHPYQCNYLDNHKHIFQARFLKIEIFPSNCKLYNIQDQYKGRFNNLRSNQEMVCISYQLLLYAFPNKFCIPSRQNKSNIFLNQATLCRLKYLTYITSAFLLNWIIKISKVTYLTCYPNSQSSIRIIIIIKFSAIDISKTLIVFQKIMKLASSANTINTSSAFLRACLNLYIINTHAQIINQLQARIHNEDLPKLHFKSVLLDGENPSLHVPQSFDTQLAQLFPQPKYGIKVLPGDGKHPSPFLQPEQYQHLTISPDLQAIRQLSSTNKQERTKSLYSSRTTPIQSIEVATLYILEVSDGIELHFHQVQPFSVLRLIDKQSQILYPNYYITNTRMRMHSRCMRMSSFTLNHVTGLIIITIQTPKSMNKLEGQQTKLNNLSNHNILLKTFSLFFGQLFNLLKSIILKHNNFLNLEGNPNCLARYFQACIS